MFGLKKIRKKQEGYLNQGVNLSNTFAGNINKGAQGILNNANAYKQATQQGIQASNEQFEKDRASEKSEIANAGYTLQSNDVWANTNAQYSAQKARAAEAIQNQAATRILNAQQSAINNAAGLYGTGYQAQAGGLNALAGYAQNQYNSKLGMLGAGLDFASKFIPGSKK